MRNPVAANFLQQASLVGIHLRRNAQQKASYHRGPLVGLISSNDDATKVGKDQPSPTTSSETRKHPSKANPSSSPPQQQSPRNTTTIAEDDDAVKKKVSSSSSSSTLSWYENGLKYISEMIEETSGFTEIEQLKLAVQEASGRFDRATKRVAECRHNLAEARKTHDMDHKKHVSLLMRREEWSAEDAASFVTITGNEVKSKQALVDAQDQLKRCEDDAINCQHAYMDLMRQRYHEEQLWQDKARLFGTYGTWSLIGINTLVFLMTQYRAERRETKRLSSMEQLLIKSQEEVVSAITETTTTLKEDSNNNKKKSSHPSSAVDKVIGENKNDGSSSASTGQVIVEEAGQGRNSDGTTSGVVEGRDKNNNRTPSPIVAPDKSKKDSNDISPGAPLMTRFRTYIWRRGDPARRGNSPAVDHHQVLAAAAPDETSSSKMRNDQRSLLNNNKNNIFGFPVHTPSVCLGAGMTASVFIVVLALFRGR